MSIKKSLKKISLVSEYLHAKRIIKWVRSGYQTPVVHDVKQLTILYHAIANKVDTLIETGTFLGDMVWAQKGYFKKIYSIELSHELYEAAKKRFRNYNHITLIEGDSSEKIKELVDELKGPAVFWLDGHYSGGITAKGNLGCPIFGELQHIFRSAFSNVILIDDARLFVGQDDYPTLEELLIYVRENSGYSAIIENDIIILRKQVQLQK